MVDFQTFYDWIKTHFTDIRVSNGKIKVHSIFCDDKKRHLWCKPSIGYYHCWKSGKKGTLFDLVMEIEKCSYDEAVEILGGDTGLRYFESKLDALFHPKEYNQPQVITSNVKFPPDTFPIRQLAENNPLRKHLEDYLLGRKLPVGSLYICLSGEYMNRIVIPYYGPNGELLYWNARDITGKSKLRYKGPHKEMGINKENVLWMSFWPQPDTKIYLTEGEFDAMSLVQCGLHGAASGGKEVSKNQIQLLLPYRVCIAFDNDPSGKDALANVGQQMLRSGLLVSYVRPPKTYKDWNEMFCKVGKNVTSTYIKKNEKDFDDSTASLLRL